MEYDNTNSGALFGAENYKVIRQGKLDIEGQEENVCITQSEGRNGKTFIEVWVKAGNVWQNDKRTERDPDISGDVVLRGQDYKFYGRKRVSNRTGASFTAVNIDPKVQETRHQSQVQETTPQSTEPAGSKPFELDEAIPF